MSTYPVPSQSPSITPEQPNPSQEIPPTPTQSLFEGDSYTAIPTQPMPSVTQPDVQYMHSPYQQPQFTQHTGHVYHHLHCKEPSLSSKDQAH